MATPVGSAADGVVISRVFPRVVAYFIDGLLLGAVGVIVGVPLGLYDADRDATTALIVGVILVLVDLLYFIGLWTSGLQATVGMRLLRLRVLDAGTAGTMRLNDALLRWIGLAGAIGILGLVPGLEGYIGLIGADLAPGPAGLDCDESVSTRACTIAGLGRSSSSRRPVGRVWPSRAAWSSSSSSVSCCRSRGSFSTATSCATS